MHTIVPFDRWQDLYNSSEDKRSPFYGQTYSEYECQYSVYNYYIHPQWDEIGSYTLYVKILYINYDLHCCIIELLGEWNDILHNDIMYLKRNIAEVLTAQGINKFILIGENIMNFHAGEDDPYYQEWQEELEGGWIAGINFRDHVVKEFQQARLGKYIEMGGLFSDVNWRPQSPIQLFLAIDGFIGKRIEATL